MPAKDYLSFNPRLESMIVEVRTEWPSEAAEISRDERTALSRRLHADPSACDEVRYDRAHTGFTRVVVATANDLRRLGVNIPEAVGQAASDSADADAQARQSDEPTASTAG